MYKSALAALSLALSFGLLTVPVSADDQSNQNSQGQGSNGQGNNNNQDSNGNGGNGNGGSGSGGNSNGSDSSGKGNNTVTNSKTPASTSTTSTSSSTTTKEAPAKAATPAAATPVYVQTYGKYANTAKPASTTTTVTSTGAQKSTSTTTKTASATPATAAAGSAAGTATVSKKSKDEVVTLQESGDKKYLSTKAKTWQTFEGYITLKPGQEALPLTMTVTNDGYTGITMFIAGQKLATDKDFKGQTLRMQMTGALAAGDNKLSVQTYGPVGANLTWKLTTTRPSITSLKPAIAALDEEVTITGRGFSKIANNNVVIIDKNKLGVVKAGTSTSGKEIVFNLPKDVLSGKTTISVSVGGIVSKPMEFTIKGAPEVTGVDVLSAPPGNPMVITGKGFATNASDNVVTIGGTPAQIISASKTSITVTIPEMYFPQWNLAVVVKTGGVESKGAVKVNIQSRMIPNDGVPEQ